MITGCTLINIMTIKNEWSSSMKKDLVHLLAFTNKIPKFSCHMSSKGKDFLSKCFIKYPKKRWMAKMLFKHHQFLVQNPIINCSPSHYVGSFSLPLIMSSTCGFIWRFSTLKKMDIHCTLLLNIIICWLTYIFKCLLCLYFNQTFIIFIYYWGCVWRVRDGNSIGVYSDQWPLNKNALLFYHLKLYLLLQK